MPGCLLLLLLLIIIIIIIIIITLIIIGGGGGGGGRGAVRRHSPACGSPAVLPLACTLPEEARLSRPWRHVYAGHGQHVYAGHGGTVTLPMAAR